MLSALISFILPFWLVRNTKNILFWVYLWQLKQYHRGRFFDHFRTEKGKKLLFQPFQIFKIGLVIVSIFSFLFLSAEYLLFLPLILFLIYFLESLLYFKGLFAKKTKYPVLTKKTVFLVIVIVLITLFYPFFVWLFVNNISWFSFVFLIFDIFLPLIVSAVVLLFQPLADFYRLSLQKKAKEKINKLKNITIIAITGSYGKTSTKEYLTTILSKKFKVLSTKEHQNTEIGIPQCILNDLKPEHKIFIVEMGAYDKGTIKRICDFVKPEIGIVTGVNEQHLALFKSMDSLLSAEGGRELLECLPKDGLIIVNGENKHCQDLYKEAKIRKLIYSFSEKSDISVKNINIEKESVSFSAKTQDGETQDFKAKVFGKHNILNLLASILVAKELGVSLKEIAQASEKITTKQFSFKIMRNSRGLNIIDSTYSANPDGVIADLDYLKIYPGKKIIIMPCLIELGKAAKEIHYRIGKKIAEVCDLAIITSKECFEFIKEGAVKNGFKEDNIVFISDANLILGKTKSFCGSNDTILLEGRLSEPVINKLAKQ